MLHYLATCVAKYVVIYISYSYTVAKHCIYVWLTVSFLCVASQQNVPADEQISYVIIH